MSRTHAPWPKASPGFVRAALQGHSLLGLAMGGLLYLVCLSGAATVFLPEIQRWETPRAPEMAAIAPQAAAAAIADARTAAGASATAGLFAELPTQEVPRLTVSVAGRARAYDAQGRYAGEAAHPIADDLAKLHYALQLPAGLGLAAVGAAGIVLVALMAGGLLAHPRILKDAFLWRRRAAPRLSLADLHNRLGVWGAPFHAAVALTGAVMGLRQAIVLLTAWGIYGGDRTAAAAALAPAEPAAAVAGRISPAGLAQALESVPRIQPDAIPSFVRIDAPGADRERLTVTALLPDRLVYGEAWSFDGAGRLAGSQHLSDGPAGRQVEASLYRLHVGSFGGIWGRLAYLVLGLGLSAVCASGLDIWLARSAQAGRPRPRLARVWAGLVWGAPAAMAAAATAALLGGASFARAFWPLLLVFAAVGLAAPEAPAAARAGRGLLAASLAGLAGAHLLKFGADVAGSPAALTLDATLAAVALLILLPLSGEVGRSAGGG